MPLGSLSAVPAAQPDAVGSIHSAVIANSSSHTKKNSTLPAVRRRNGTMSNRIAKKAVTDSAGSVSTSTGFTISTRSRLRSSARTHCAATPTASPTTSTTQNTTMWPAHLASR